VAAGAILAGARIGPHSYLGRDAYLELASTGPFCSIGPRAMVGLSSHPIDFVSTYPGFIATVAPCITQFGGTATFEELRPVEVGADVWIGAGAIVLGGVKIGTGAIVAAGAVVRADVAPYSIVGGVPAKPIKWRFPEGLRARLLASAWWTLPETVLRQHVGLMTQPAAFVDKIEELRHGAPAAAEPPAR
jgi:acetyltransferase-like isoleucine patch superfamily enzyme